MAFSTPYTFTALELLTAAKMNAIQTNIAAIWAGTSAGDIDYYTSATTKGRLAIGSAYKTMRVNAAGTGFEYTSNLMTKLSGSGDQTVAAGAPILWGTENFDDGGWHSTSSNTSRITLPATGRYKAYCNLNLWTPSGGATAVYSATIQKNAAVVSRAARPFYQEGTTQTLPFGGVPFNGVAAEYVEVMYATGGVVNMDYSWFAVERVG